jgi:hypothetical protein
VSAQTKTVFLLGHPWPGFQVVRVAEDVEAIVIPGKPAKAYWADESALIVDQRDLPLPVNEHLAEPGAATFRFMGMSWGYGIEVWTRDGRASTLPDIRAEILAGIRNIDRHATPDQRAVLMMALSDRAEDPIA